MAPAVDYLAHLRTESARFDAVLAEAAPDAPVPCCPQWDAEDLRWHLAEVQWFWATIVAERLTAPPPPDRRPQRPADRSELRSFFQRVSAELAQALTEADPGQHAWTWSSEQTVGFIRRRQAHEALIHRLDAELSAGTRSPLDPQLSADGVDEALHVMYGNLPDWATFEADSSKVIRLRASDTGDTWFVCPGQLTGTDPTTASSVAEASLRVLEPDTERHPAATVTGSAADLDCWLWRRPTLGPIERAGDQLLLDQLESVLAAGID